MTAALGTWGKRSKMRRIKKESPQKSTSKARLSSSHSQHLSCVYAKAGGLLWFQGQPAYREMLSQIYKGAEQTSSRRSRRVRLVKSLSLGPIPLQECHVCDAGLCSLEIMHPIKYPLRLLPNPCIRGLLDTSPLLCWMHFSVVSIVAVPLSPSRQSERMERTWLNLESPGAG